MLAHWLSGFIAGTIIGRIESSTSITKSVLAAMFAVLAVALWFKLARRTPPALCPKLVCLVPVFVSLLGCLWGVLHAAPTACQSLADAAVIARVGAFRGSGPLIVGTKDGHRYEVMGRQAGVLRGRVAAQPAARLLAPCFARFRATMLAEEKTGSLFSGLSELLHTWILGRIAQLPWSSRAFLRGIIAGDKSRLSLAVVEAFRKTGLYHLLVVSGQHVTLIAMILAAFFKSPLQCAYALRLIEAKKWLHISAFLNLLVGGLILVYAASTGMSAASQRAALSFVVWQATRVFCGAAPLGTRLLLVASLQAGLFPVGFLGEASLMSWLAYLIIVRTFSHKRSKIDHMRLALVNGAKRALVMQFYLLLATFAVFGQMSILGLIANSVFVPVFSSVMVLALSLVIWPSSPWVDLAVAMQNTYIELLFKLSALCNQYTWLAPSSGALPSGLRIVACVVMAAVFLNTCRFLSIRTSDET